MALLVGAALLGLHFCAASISQMPLTPIKLRVMGSVNDYLEPYQAQNWKLFAPNPLSENRGIFARGRCANGEVTGFYDVTSRYIDAAQSSRFFPSRMSRLVTGNVLQLSGGDPVLDELREQQKALHKRPLPETPLEKKNRREAVAFLSRYSLTQMPKVCGGSPDKVQVRVYVEKLPPWSKRNDPKARGKTDLQDMDWVKVGSQ
ncbi:DUF5819 family protein [Streptomyces sp. NPDC059101]|uniref:DUF5819 family protein n=1 Tax=unclassified Streptomyces TaxID=2593676 RepID=UPI000C28060C|nr:DUF5819 family protein [Streptomyces sp. CB02959]PJN36688.1 hypothetical protein CG747_32740 [Streptomyces sp. CB02959]